MPEQLSTMNKSLFRYYEECITKNFLNFKGRARRREFWGFMLFNALITPMVSTAMYILARDLHIDAFLLVAYIWSVLMLVPALAVTIRRLHDIGRGGWSFFFNFNVIGIFILLYWFCRDSEPGENKWGFNPKEFI